MPNAGRKLKSVHPLLGEIHTNPDDNIFYLGELQLAALSYLKDHQIYDYIVYPAAGYLEMILLPDGYGIGEGVIHATNVSIESALSLNRGKPVQSQVLMNPIDSGYDLGIYTLGSTNTWNTHARGSVSVNRLLEKEPIC